jgi:hypothetical protein
MNTEYIDSLKATLTSGLKIQYPHLTKEACEKVVGGMVAAHPTGLIKEAASLPMNQMFGGAMRDAAGKATVAAIAGAGLYGLNRLVRSADQDIAKTRFESALRQVLSSNDQAGQIIKSVDRAKVMSLANTIFEYAPSVAGDVNILKSLLATYVNSDGIDPSTIRSLQELEMNKKNLQSWKPSDLGFKG